jgi:hypothetical protein
MKMGEMPIGIADEINMEAVVVKKNYMHVLIKCRIIALRQ